MVWKEIRLAYPDQWLVIEALEAHTSSDHRRNLVRMAVIEPCADGKAAFASYRRYHQQFPQREFYFVHTSREDLEIREQHWVGIRQTYAA